MINEGYEFNFKTLLAAAHNGDLALVECTDKATGKVVIAVCAIATYEDGMTDIIPVAKMFDGSPYDELDPPDGATLHEEDLH
jgi:hypothetical protein